MKTLKVGEIVTVEVQRVAIYGSGTGRVSTKKLLVLWGPDPKGVSILRELVRVKGIRRSYRCNAAGTTLLSTTAKYDILAWKD